MALADFCLVSELFLSAVFQLSSLFGFHLVSFVDIRRQNATHPALLVLLPRFQAIGISEVESSTALRP